MTPHADVHCDAPRRSLANPSLFFRRWIRNPAQMGSIIPSSPALCARIVAQSHWENGEAVVELGAGTGVVSAALLAAGLPPSRLFVIEIVPEMADHLRAILPGANVITGDALNLVRLIPAHWHGRIGTVICGIPMLLLRDNDQQCLVDAMETVAPGRGFLHFSYCATSPIDRKRLGLAGQRKAWTPLNIPPASVWHYRKLPTR